LQTHIVIPNPNMVMNMVNDIRSVLNIGKSWQLNSITAFTFLDYYYPYFKPIGVFKHRCLNEIIVQAQGGEQNKHSIEYNWNLVFNWNSLDFGFQFTLQNMHLLTTGHL